MPPAGGSALGTLPGVSVTELTGPARSHPCPASVLCGAGSGNSYRELSACSRPDPVGIATPGGGAPRWALESAQNPWLPQRHRRWQFLPGWLVPAESEGEFHRVPRGDVWPPRTPNTVFGTPPRPLGEDNGGGGLPGLVVTRRSHPARCRALSGDFFLLPTAEDTAITEQYSNGPRESSPHRPYPLTALGSTIRVVHGKQIAHVPFRRPLRQRPVA